MSFLLQWTRSSDLRVLRGNCSVLVVDLQETTGAAQIDSDTTYQVDATNRLLYVAADAVKIGAPFEPEDFIPEETDTCVNTDTRVSSRHFICCKALPWENLGWDRMLRQYPRQLKNCRRTEELQSSYLFLFHRAS